MSLLDEALEGAERSGERVADAELHRLRGGILLAQRGGAMPATSDDGAEQALACGRAATTFYGTS